ncbi:eCIS core domain-containing protein [Chryseobacterium luquanense]|uniref:DUF4157 domain-containing protein n=1 Tax=Chryseobacterium luquanense TaxID=2983766 RepID=A0ABT3XZ51_9FLAO|nr:DUF4157 domain-containing protein [Chryseobacterium luquanense]MCX8531135.1 DUF4157 domain-containing protein [Chryseobacterium luquanense]
MKRLIFTTAIILLFTNICFGQSWLSRITGVDVNLNNGTVSIKPPDVTAIPPMLQNLPKDVGQTLLNPAAPILASAIRFSKGQAQNRGTQPIPQNIKQQLSKYFPQHILESTSWTTANGISIDGMLKNWLNQEGAVTLDNVICFSSVELTTNVELWAHELTHVLQYDQMGVETFAFVYSTNWNSLEGQANENASRIIQNINSYNQGNTQSWTYNIASTVGQTQLTWENVNKQAKLSIPPTDCIWVNNQNNTTGNKCPCSILVTGVIMKRISDGFVTTMPCNEPTCLFPAGQSGPLLSPPGFIITGVTAAHQY